MADDRRCFGALLNGLARRNYLGDTELTNELLKEQIYPNTSDEEFQQLVTKCTALTKVGVSWQIVVTVFVFRFFNTPNIWFE